ncbi:MAG: NAD(P)H-hydrate dehydratase [Oscillospiraceae bacterium]|nr:NAD(P)H-hydrate dehydratase [Oscillospiraceae bacterium]
MTIRKLDRDAVRGLLPPRAESSHKGTFGRLTIAAGCDRYRGAAVLCARGALACGAGLICVASTEKALAAVAAHVPEAILIDAQTDRGYLAQSLAASTAVAAGCGLSQSDEALALLETALRASRCPLVLDADGINLLAARIELRKELCGREVILTPHLGEFARLTGTTVAAVAAYRAAAAARYAAESGWTVVLKSDRTVVAFPDGEVFVNALGNAGLAKGGSGDLLCGAVASLAAMGIGARDAALLGVYLHSRAADLCAARIPEHSMSPSLVADFLPAAVAELQSDEKS